MKSYDTVTEAVKGLKEKGFVTDFNIKPDKIVCDDNNITLHPDEFEIVEVHRFEGNSDPNDEDVVYAVQSKDAKIKGVITSAFGLYADPSFNKIIQKLSMHTEK